MKRYKAVSSDLFKFPAFKACGPDGKKLPHVISAETKLIGNEVRKRMLEAIENDTN